MCWMQSEIYTELIDWTRESELSSEKIEELLNIVNKLPDSILAAENKQNEDSLKTVINSLTDITTSLVQLLEDNQAVKHEVYDYLESLENQHQTITKMSDNLEFIKNATSKESSHWAKEMSQIKRLNTLLQDQLYLTLKNLTYEPSKPKLSVRSLSELRGEFTSQRGKKQRTDIAGNYCVNLVLEPLPKGICTAANVKQKRQFIVLDNENEVAQWTSKRDPNKDINQFMFHIAMVNDPAKFDVLSSNTTYEKLIAINCIFPIKTFAAFLKLEELLSSPNGHHVKCFFELFKPRIQWNERVYMDALRDVISDNVLSLLSVDNEYDFSQYQIFQCLIVEFAPTNKQGFKNLIKNAILEAYRREGTFSVGHGKLISEPLDIVFMKTVASQTDLPLPLVGNLTVADRVQFNALSKRVQQQKMESNQTNIVLDDLIKAFNVLLVRISTLEKNAENVIQIHSEIDTLAQKSQQISVSVSEGKISLTQEHNLIQEYIKEIESKVTTLRTPKNANFEELQEIYPLKTLQEVDLENKRLTSNQAHAVKLSLFLTHMRERKRKDFKEILAPELSNNFEPTLVLYHIIKSTWFNDNEDEMMRSLKCYRAECEALENEEVTTVEINPLTNS